MIKKITVFIITLWISTLNAQQSKEVDMIEFIYETQQWKKEKNEMFLGWYMPEEYWGITLRDNQQFNEQIIQKIEDAFDGYILVGTAAMQISSNGKSTFNTKNQIKNTLILVDQNGNEYKPLEDDQINDKQFEILRIMNPVLAQTLGKFGNGVHFFLFENKSKEQEGLILSADKEGDFRVIHSGYEFYWNLPMNSLIPSKYCPVDNEKMNGNWNFCPIHGSKI